jgi:hypothetical protein
MLGTFWFPKSETRIDFYAFGLYLSQSMVVEFSECHMVWEIRMWVLRILLQDWDPACMALLFWTGLPINIEDLADNIKVVLMPQSINLCVLLFHFLNLWHCFVVAVNFIIAFLIIWPIDTALTCVSCFWNILASFWQASCMSEIYLPKCEFMYVELSVQV